MSKQYFGVLAFLFLCSSVLAQENANNVYVNDNGDVFVKADAPI